MILPILSVKDVEASITFYTTHLNFKQQFAIPGEDGKPNFAFIELDRATIIALSLDPSVEKRGAGVDLMVYVPDEMSIDDVYAQVQKAGIPLVEEIGDRYWGDRTFAINDPDGYRITVSKTVKQMSFEEAMQNMPQQNP